MFLAFQALHINILFKRYVAHIHSRIYFMMNVIEEFIKNHIKHYHEYK